VLQSFKVAAAAPLPSVVQGRRMVENRDDRSDHLKSCVDNEAISPLGDAIAISPLGDAIAISPLGDAIAIAQSVF
jgi:hypothetical protein